MLKKSGYGIVIRVLSTSHCSAVLPSRYNLPYLPPSRASRAYLAISDLSFHGVAPASHTINSIASPSPVPLACTHTHTLSLHSLVTSLSRHTASPMDRHHSY